MITQMFNQGSGQTTFTDTALGAVDAVKSSSCKLFSILIDNSANSGAVTYICLFNQASGNITLGTSSPDLVIMVPAGAIIQQSFFTGQTSGLNFSVALSIAAKTSGGTGGNTAPSASTVCSVVYQ